MVKQRIRDLPVVCLPGRQAEPMPIDQELFNGPGVEAG
jgi:hypothetical protein